MQLDDSDKLPGTYDVMPTYTERFANGGLTFENAYTASPKCCPSRTALLSGRYPHNLNDESLGWCGDFVSEGRYNEMFFAQLKTAGYANAMVGKLTNNLGEMCTSVAHVPTGLDGADDHFVAMCTENKYYGNVINNNGKLVTLATSGDDQYLTAYLGNNTIPWLKTAAANAAAGKAPFFAYLAPHAPHFPAEPAPWYINAKVPHDTAPRTTCYGACTAGKNWAIEVGFRARMPPENRCIFFHALPQALSRTRRPRPCPLSTTNPPVAAKRKDAVLGRHRGWDRLPLRQPPALPHVG